MNTALLITFTGIAIVFTLLCLLVAIIYLFGKIANKSDKKSNDVKPSVVQVPVVKPVDSALPIQDDLDDDFIPGEVIAAIAAAVSEVGSQDGKNYVVKKVRRERGARPVWACAGIADNTRPF